MKSDKILKKFLDEIKGKNRPEVIISFESILTENIEEICSNKSFFNLPLTNIFSIVSKVNILDLEGAMDIITQIITNTINAHQEEKETILLLNYLQTNEIDFSLNEIVSILTSFTNCDLLVKFGNLYIIEDVNVDYEYELQQKEKIIVDLKNQLEHVINHIPPIEEKPDDYEPDIFKAIQQGKLSSVQYLIEKEGVSTLTKNHVNDSLLHIAAQYNEIIIAKYLIINQKLSPDIRGSSNCTPLHIGCFYGNLPIVQYLIFKTHANYSVLDDNEKEPIQYACYNNQLNIIQFFVETLRVPIDKIYQHQTLLHIASDYGLLDIVEYLVKKGANVNIKDGDKQTPFDIACRTYNKPDKVAKRNKIRAFL